MKKDLTVTFYINFGDNLWYVVKTTDLFKTCAFLVHLLPTFIINSTRRAGHEAWVRAWYVISGSLLLTFRWNKNTQLTINSSPLKLYSDYVQFLSFLLPTDTFSFRGKTSLFMSAGYLNHVHQAENSLIVLYCHEKLDPPALLRKLRCLSCFYLGIWFRSTLQFYIKSLKNDNFWKVWNPEKTKVWSFFPCEKLTFPFTSRSLRLNNVFP